MSILALQRGILRPPAGGAPPYTGTVFQPSAGALATTDNNYNNAIRVLCTLSNPAAQKIRVRLECGNIPLIFKRVTIGKHSGTGSNTTGTPLPFLFGGVGNGNITVSPGFILSDALDISALALIAGNKVVVSFDCGGDGGTAYNTGNSNVDTFWKAPGEEANNASPSGMTQEAGVCYAVRLLEAVE